MRLTIASLDGRRATDAFYYGGRRPVREAVLRSGHRVTGTPNHLVLTCDDGQLAWRRLDELEPGDQVATQYGDDLWAPAPASFADFVPSPSWGSQKVIAIPEAMTERLAFVLGAYAAEGHISRSTHTVKISNADETVIARLVALMTEIFERVPKVVRPVGRCPSVELSSKRLVEFLDYLGCGNGAAHKRVPDAILRSPRAMVLRFIEGLSLDAYLTTTGMAKWAICVDSPRLLDDLQAILTNLGIVHGRVSKYNAPYDKTFDEVYAAGREAQRLVGMIDFAEPHKALRAAEIASRQYHQTTADVVPGVSGRELYELIPAGTSGRSGAGTGLRQRHRHLVDPRTTDVSRESVVRLAEIPGVELPEWLQQVVERNLHFSPVTSVIDAGEREVFDISVPGTHAFVANGIVNHNTVNLPQAATVEDIADAYLQAWRMGVKALAIYRDGSKTAQALRTEAHDVQGAAEDGAFTQEQVDTLIAQAVDAAVAETAVAAREEGRSEALRAAGPARKRMPRERQSITHKFSIAGHEGYITAGMYDDGSLGEIFLTDIGKEGST
ncbi:MAG: hypothetical protein M3401_10305, partial [Actinomycetota bacterium]|nr:hypothetical protein [Actinomycetota bacterium]